MSQSQPKQQQTKQQQQQPKQPRKEKKEKQESGFRGTLNLPQTSFPMRAGLIENEPKSMDRWASSDLYGFLRARRSDAARPENRGRWPFHDGPPYASGSLHLGHLLNKSLKDFVVRSRTMRGYDVPYVPGWDCHGLPIEHRVLTNMMKSGEIRKLDGLRQDERRMAIRRECATAADHFVNIQATQMKRLLTLADYDHPYLTMRPEFEADTLNVFADMVANGLVYRALKPVHWSIANETALAEAELEYEDRVDPSIYVNFEVESVGRLAEAFGVGEHEIRGAASLPAAVMIWTTTPWTLPANLAVAVHPKFRYLLVVIKDRPVVVASELLEAVLKCEFGADVSQQAPRVLGDCFGEALVGVTYRHPLVDNKTGRVVPAEYVTLEDGTGLVHTAPGHGQEDYQTGINEGLDIYCPVQGNGTFDDTVPSWLQGVSVWDANDKVIGFLREQGTLYHMHKFTHSYPHDWRSKTPVIFRATQQWFIAVNQAMPHTGRSLRDMALDVTGQEVAFHPEWGRNRMRGMLESRPDWCISRQRAWGLPIPAFATAAGEIVLTEAMVRAVAKKVREAGSDVWFTGEPAVILEHYDPASDPDAPVGLDVAALQKTYDIFDVWFESGSSWNAVMRGRGIGYPVELYLEGSDQHRGWFQLSLLCGLGSTGQSPFKALLTHGFMVDKDGRKMSKSVGNTLEVDDLLRDFGADVCRWWVAGLNYENDIKADREFFAVAGESYRKVRNTLRFLLSNLYDFNPASMRGLDRDGGVPANSLDAWVLGEYNRLAHTVLSAFDEYDYRKAQTAIYDFCNETLSAVYCAAVKDRLYCDHPDSPRRRRTQRVMWELMEGLCRFLAPILPHTADEAYRALYNVEDGNVDLEHSIHAQTYIESFGVEVDAEWPKVMRLRDAALRLVERARAGKVVDNPLDAEVEVPDHGRVLRGFAERLRAATTGSKGGGVNFVGDRGEDFASDFADLLGVSRVRFIDPQPAEETGGDAEAAIKAAKRAVETGSDSLAEAGGRVRSLLEEPRCERSWKRDGTVKVHKVTLPPTEEGGEMRVIDAPLTDRDAEAIGAK